MQALGGSIRIAKQDSGDAWATYAVTFAPYDSPALAPRVCHGIGQLEEYLANFLMDPAYLRPAVEQARTHGLAQVLRVMLPECNWGKVEGVL